MHDSDLISEKLVNCFHPHNSKSRRVVLMLSTMSMLSPVSILLCLFLALFSSQISHGFVLIPKRTLVIPKLLSHLSSASTDEQDTTDTTGTTSTSADDVVIQIKPKAMERLRELKLKQPNPEDVMVLRMGVRNGGCSGLSYVMDFSTEDAIEEDDAVDEYTQDNIKCVVDAKSMVSGRQRERGKEVLSILLFDACAQLDRSPVTWTCAVVPLWIGAGLFGRVDWRRVQVFQPQCRRGMWLRQ
jgi:Fe-S cluster assembly iron-binding protein IscA